MNLPESLSKEITESIMRSFSKFGSDPVLVLETQDYNRVYSRVYEVLKQNKVDEHYKKAELLDKHFKNKTND